MEKISQIKERAPLKQEKNIKLIAFAALHSYFEPAALKHSATERSSDAGYLPLLVACGMLNCEEKKSVKYFQQIKANENARNKDEGEEEKPKKNIYIFRVLSEKKNRER